MSCKLTSGIVAILVFTSFSSAETIILSSGERLEGSMVSKSDATIHVRHAILGDLHIPAKHVRSIEQSLKVDVVSAPIDTNGIELPAQERASKWNQTIKLGAGYQSGQTDNLDLNTSYHANRTQNEHEVQYDLRYRFAKTDSTRSANRFSGAWGNKWLQTDRKWDIFTNLQFDWAEFQSWDQRIVGDIGAGYELYAYTDGEESFKVSSRFGGGIRKEFQSQNEDVIPEGLLGLSLDWKLPSDQSFKADSTWYPDFQDSANYRFVSNASWNIKIDKANNLDFSIGLHHEYDSVVDEDVKKTYLQLTAGITYSF